MTYFSECINEWQALIQDLRKYIAQEHPEQVISMPVAKAIPKKSAEAPKVAKTTPVPQKKPEPVIPAPTGPRIMQAMPRPFVKPPKVPLEDCLEKFKTLEIQTVDAPEEKVHRRRNQIVFISFFQPKSDDDAFIKKVAASVSERLMPISIFSQPDTKAAALTQTLTATKEARAVIIAAAKEDSSKVSSWLANFGEDLKVCSIQKEALVSKRELFDVPFYELSLSTLDKRALWNDLKSLA